MTAARILMAIPRQMLPTRYGEAALAGLHALGEVVLHNDKTQPSGERLAQLAKGCDIVVADHLSPATEELFISRPELAAFLRRATDLRTVDLDAASRHGVVVTRAGFHFAHSVSELIVGQILVLARGLHSYCSAYHERRVPSLSMGIQVAGRVVGIVGIGGLIARRLTISLVGIGAVVIGCDVREVDLPAGATLGSFDEVVANADFLVALAPLQPQNERMFGRAVFRRMKRGAFFVNVARGGLVDEVALEEALRNGTIAGAALDVGSGVGDTPALELASLPNVIATPHIGGLVPDNIYAQAADTVEQAAAVLRGEVPPGAANPGHCARLRRFRAPTPIA